MKIYYTERNFDELTPGILQKENHEVYVPKEDVEDVHTFGRPELIATLKEIKPDVLVVGLKFIIDQEIIDCAPIKAIFTRTTATDHITAQGVEIYSLRGEDLSDVVAVPELTIGMAIYLMRTMYDIGFELRGKKIGLIGYGRIGRLLDEYAVAFKMHIYYYDKNKPEYSLDELLKNADIVSLHVTADESNRNFMDMEKFKMMKEGSWFLNPSRPWLVDDEALKWALDNRLAGAWVDFDMPFTHDHLITTPHLGGRTYESSIKTERIIRDKILSWSKK